MIWHYHNYHGGDNGFIMKISYYYMNTTRSSQIHTYKNIYSRWYIQTWATILFEAITGLCCFLSLMPRPFVNLQIQYHKNYLCRNGNMISKFNMGIISAPYFPYYAPKDINTNSYLYIPIQICFKFGIQVLLPLKFS